MRTVLAAHSISTAHIAIRVEQYGIQYQTLGFEERVTIVIRTCRTPFEGSAALGTLDSTAPEPLCISVSRYRVYSVTQSAEDCATPNSSWNSLLER